MRYIYLFLLLLGSYSLHAASTVLDGDLAMRRVPGAQLIRLDEHGLITYIRFAEGRAPTRADLLVHQPWMPRIASRLSYQLLNSYTDPLGQVHHRLQVEQDGIPVEGSLLILHEYGGRVRSLNGDVFPLKGQATTPSVTEENAFQKALQAMPAHRYQWEGQGPRPAGELYYAPVGGDYAARKFRLAWRFDIYAVDPLAREWIYVDAITGEVIDRRNRIQHVDAVGTAQTKYSGLQPITADSLSPFMFHLFETGRGGGIHTRNLLNGFDTGQATEFEDDDNYWNNYNAAQDEVAADCHVGTEVTYDYYFNNYNWNSYDNQGTRMYSYVHYGTSFDNAFWDGTAMTYGDGGGGLFTSPLTTPDICGHEVTHGVTEHSAGLIYAGESGALNESFSDIFGTVIEYTLRPNNWSWILGEDCTPGGAGIRSMADPNIHNNPDTYLGAYWDGGSGTSAGGVHTNSGVQNKWFFLLSDGETGTNDNGANYSVTGIGIDKAAQIAFRNLTVYLTPSSEYQDARFYAIESARDLFGNCSNEFIQTINAWHGVGVGAPFSNIPLADFEPDQDEICTLPATVAFLNLSTPSDSYLWDFGDGNTSTSPNPVHTYTNWGSYTVTLSITSCTGGTDTITIPAAVQVDSNLVCPTTMATLGWDTLSECFGILLDPGGQDNYPDDAYSVLTIAPPGADFITVNFSSFQLESGYDYLTIYDGPNLNAPTIGGYTGYSLPNGGSVSSSGSSMTLEFYSDFIVNESGFEAEWECTIINAPPNVQAETSPGFSCDGVVNFTDASTLAPFSWEWDFGDGNTSNQQNPVHTYSASGFYTVQLVACNVIGCDTLVMPNAVLVSLGQCGDSSQMVPNDTLLLTNCQGSVTDDGGSSWNYSNNFFGIITIAPPGATDLELAFSQFDLEMGYDYLRIYDGPNTQSPLMGTFTGDFWSLPNSGVFQSSTGALTLDFRTDGSVTYPGFIANWVAEGSTNGPQVNLQVPDTAYVGIPASFQVLSPNNAYYNWNLGDGTYLTLDSLGHSYTAAGTYQVWIEVTDSTGCSVSLEDSVVVVLPVGRSEPEMGSLSFWPNPSTGVLHLDYQFEGSQQLDLEVVNLLGQPVYRGHFAAHRSFQRDLDLTQASKGLYFLRLKSEKGTLVRKFVLE